MSPEQEVQRLRVLTVEYLQIIQHNANIIAKLIDDQERWKQMASELADEIKAWMQSVNWDKNSDDVLRKYQALKSENKQVNAKQQMLDV